MIVGLDAGDWRRPDDEFAASFRAPPTRCDALRLRNPFPRESRMHFDEPSRACEKVTFWLAYEGKL